MLWDLGHSDSGFKPYPGFQLGRKSNSAPYPFNLTAGNNQGNKKTIRPGPMGALIR